MSPLLPQDAFVRIEGSAIRIAATVMFWLPWCVLSLAGANPDTGAATSAFIAREPYDPYRTSDRIALIRQRQQIGPSDRDRHGRGNEHAAKLAVTEGWTAEHGYNAP